MKKVKTTLFLLAAYLLSTSLTAQSDSVFISKQSDDMEDKSYYYPSRKIICVAADKKKGFSCMASVDENKSNLQCGGLTVKMINIGSCCEKNELIFLFEDDSKITVYSWNDFNCKGNAWFNLTSSEEKKLASLRLKKIKIKNGSTFDSYTHEMQEDQDYFIQFFIALKSQKVTEVKK